jgi:hypothetical protein
VLANTRGLVGVPAVPCAVVLGDGFPRAAVHRETSSTTDGEVSVKMVDPAMVSSQAAVRAPAAPPAAAAPKSKDELALLVKDLTSPSQCEATQCGVVQAKA